MKPVLKEGEQAHFIEIFELIQFIHINSNMDWNTAGDYIQEIALVNDDVEYTNWSRECANNEHIGDEAQYWMLAFYEAHPWLDDINFIFTD